MKSRHAIRARWLAVAKRGARPVPLDSGTLPDGRSSSYRLIVEVTLHHRPQPGSGRLGPTVMELLHDFLQLRPQPLGHHLFRRTTNRPVVRAVPPVPTGGGVKPKKLRVSHLPSPPCCRPIAPIRSGLSFPSAVPARTPASVPTSLPGIAPLRLGAGTPFDELVGVAHGDHVPQNARFSRERCTQRSRT
jgi:hypothetical protein